MQYFVVIAGVLALLVLTQAQDETTLAEPSQPNSSSPVPPLILRPPRLGRPGRRPFHHFERPKPKEDSSEKSDSVSSEDNDHPHREPVLLNVDVKFGQGNTIIENQREPISSTATY